MKVISGGQTGVDRAGLIAAKKNGLETGGWMPRGFRALDGLHPEYRELYGMQETESDEYPPRTDRNARDSQATLRVAENFLSNGEQCTLRAIERHGRPWMDILVQRRPHRDDYIDTWVIRRIEVCGETIEAPDQQSIPSWMRQWDCLNIAGNTAEVHPSWQLWCITFVDLLLKRMSILGGVN